MTKEEINTVIELFISWNGENEPIDTANIPSAVEYVYNCVNEAKNKPKEQNTRQSTTAQLKTARLVSN